MKKRALVPLGAVIGLALVSWLLVGSGLFRIREISVEGGERVKPAEVRDLIGVRVGENIFLADLGRAREALLRLPWVRTAQVRRALPGRVRVILEERKPCAVAALAKEQEWVDREGYLLEKAPEGSGPLLRGSRALETTRGRRLDERSQLVLEALCPLGEQFLAQFTELQLQSSSPELVLQAKAGFRVLLDLEDLGARLRLLERLLTELRGNDYLYIDLRFGDVVLRPR
ncbi:MAG: FtsQ-type POTRA domain-containing protein [Candidatus Acetothermia bacterium]|nr:FtsQ-type POTRA domain-containing protein [Candidatus Acetothermia bacterium]MDH7504902.1 FtsQ-type POTRA domain-containing protein [Candidatus Acetothermia bacterium]